MAQIDINLRRSSAGSWTVDIDTVPLDMNGLTELTRVLGHCQKIIDPDSIPDPKLAPSSITKIEKLVDGDKSIKTTKIIVENSDNLRSALQSARDQITATINKGIESALAKANVRPEKGEGRRVYPDLSDELVLETSVVVKSEDGILDAAAEGRKAIAKEVLGADQHASAKLPKTKTPISKPESTFKFDPKSQAKTKPRPEQLAKPKSGGNASSLDMLNSVVAARAADVEADRTVDRDNRKPLKYNRAVREGWIDNAYGLEFTALTHPLPSNQGKLMKVLRDYAASDSGFGLVKMTDKELAKKSGLGVSSIRGTLNGLAAKDLLERDTDGKIWVY